MYGHSSCGWHSQRRRNVQNSISLKTRDTVRLVSKVRHANVTVISLCAAWCYAPGHLVVSAIVAQISYRSNSLTIRESGVLTARHKAGRFRT
jgi:hypothetical protein